MHFSHHCLFVNHLIASILEISLSALSDFIGSFHLLTDSNAKCLLHNFKVFRPHVRHTSLDCWDQLSLVHCTVSGLFLFLKTAFDVPAGNPCLSPTVILHSVTYPNAATAPCSAFGSRTCCHPLICAADLSSLMCHPFVSPLAPTLAWWTVGTPRSSPTVVPLSVTWLGAVTLHGSRYKLSCCHPWSALDSAVIRLALRHVTLAPTPITRQSVYEPSFRVRPLLLFLSSLILMPRNGPSMVCVGSVVHPDQR